MITYIKIAAVSLSMAAATVSFSGQAYAWGCSAEAADGAAADSSNFSNRKDAEDAAIKACEGATTQTCVISGCWPDA